MIWDPHFSLLSLQFSPIATRQKKKLHARENGHSTTLPNTWIFIRYPSAGTSFKQLNAHLSTGKSHAATKNAIRLTANLRQGKRGEPSKQDIYHCSTWRASPPASASRWCWRACRLAPWAFLGTSSTGDDGAPPPLGIVHHYRWHCP